MKIDKLLIVILLFIIVVIGFYIFSRHQSGGDKNLITDLVDQQVTDNPINLVEPTFPSPLAGVEFEGEVDYPDDWPEDLRFPDEYILIETTFGGYEENSLNVYGVKLQFVGDPEGVAESLSSIFLAKGWVVVEDITLDSGGKSIAFTKDNKKKQSIFVIDYSSNDQTLTNILGIISQ